MTDLGEALRQTRERSALATTMYAALKNAGRLQDVQHVTYRCQSRCTLLDVIDTPEGVLIGFPRYKTSPTVTEETSSQSGRDANTEDGERRWRQHAGFIESVSNPPLSCDHLHNVPLPDEAITSDLASGRAEVVVRRDGTRFAVRGTLSTTQGP